MQASSAFTPETREVPAAACRFAGGPVEFAEPDPAAPGVTKIRMLARSAEPIEHPWWGRVVHDMAGMKLHKETIQCDLEHFEPIGFLNQFEASDKGLFVEGGLVDTGLPGDPLPRVLALRKAGVPYEASIYFGGDGIKTEWLGEDQVADVNGYTFEGPGVIIREWPLRAVAVCSHGADMHTESAFAQSQNETFSLSHFKEVAVSKPVTKPAPAATKLSEAPAAEAPVTTPTAAPAAEAPQAEAAPESPAAAAPATETPAAAPALSADRAECKRFVDSFGADGGQWFAEGLSFEAAQVRFTQQLRKENDELKRKLAAGQAAGGEQSAVGFDSAEAKKATGFASKIRIR